MLQFTDNELRRQRVLDDAIDRFRKLISR